MTRLVLAALSLALIVMLFIAGLANAQPMPDGPKCAPRAKLIYDLANKYLESRMWHGIDGDGWMVERYENPETGTWTITRTAPAEVAKMQACIVAFGQASETFPYETGDPV
jgi:hypothetical protein